MIVAIVSADSVSSSEVVTAFAGGVTSGCSFNVDEIFQNSFTNAPAMDFGADSTELVAKVERQDDSHWDGLKGQQFKNLSLKEALGTISEGEFIELESLTRLRRTAQHPRPANEILRERAQQKITAEMVQVLNKYVEFHESPHCS